MIRGFHDPARSDLSCRDSDWGRGGRQQRRKRVVSEREGGANNTMRRGGGGITDGGGDSLSYGFMLSGEAAARQT
jgi:hypothetical protein